MSRVDRPALRGTMLGRVLHASNPLMRRLLRSPLHAVCSRWFAVIHWRGRHSGRQYSTPVSCLVEDDRVLITTGDRWWKNLTGGADVTLWVRGRERHGWAEPVLDEHQSRALHEHMFAERPIFARLAGISAADAREQILRSIRSGRTMVLVRLLDR